MQLGLKFININCFSGGGFPYVGYHVLDNKHFVMKKRRLLNTVGKGGCIVRSCQE